MSMFSVSCQHSLGTILSRHVPPSLHACKEWLDQNYVVFFFVLLFYFVFDYLFVSLSCVCVWRETVKYKRSWSSLIRE